MQTNFKRKIHPREATKCLSSPLARMPCKKNGMVPSPSKLHSCVNETKKISSTSHSSVKGMFQADDALSLSTFSSHLKHHLSRFTNIYIDPPVLSSQRKATWLFNYLTNSLPTDQDDVADVLSSSSTKPIAPHLGKLRLIKSPAEQAVMRAAADISASAHTKARASLCYQQIVIYTFYTLIRL